MDFKNISQISKTTLKKWNNQLILKLNNSNFLK
jgi:hypothetical protein